MQATKMVDRQNWANVAISGAVTVGELENTLAKFYVNATHPPKNLCLDLSGAYFIEVAALQVIIAHVAKRQKDPKLGTKLRLPADSAGLNARHFLRRWEFDEALKAGAKIALSQLVDAEDLRYFSGVPGGGDSGDPYARTEVRYEGRYGEMVYGREAYRFFSFMSWALDSYTDKAAIIESERLRWRDADRVIVEALQKNVRLRRPEDDHGSTIGIDRLIASRIMLQAMTNALRHSDASVLQAASHMAYRLKEGSQDATPSRRIDHFFTLVYWDDGQAMSETLRMAIDRGVPIHATSEMSKSYLVQYEDDYSSARSTEVIYSKEIPGRNAPAHRMFLGTLFPGVSCDIEGRNRIPSVGDERLDRLLEIPGHGLSILVEAVTEMIGGTVSFRSGDFFMNVKRLTDASWRQAKLPGEKPNYRVKIRRFPKEFPSFLGNFITVRLDLSDTNL